MTKPLRRREGLMPSILPHPYDQTNIVEPRIHRLQNGGDGRKFSLALRPDGDYHVKEIRLTADHDRQWCITKRSAARLFGETVLAAALGTEGLTPAAKLDQVIPEIGGGPNLVACCCQCNRTKGTKTPDQTTINRATERWTQ